MATRTTKRSPGEVTWMDLATPDLAVATEFYRQVFGWNYIDTGSDFGHYHMAKAMSITFQLEGQTFMTLNGGPMYSFTEAISLFVDCTTQAEVDDLWGKLTDGGQEQPCGWLKDKFGLSWQIIPKQLGELMQDEDPQKAQRVIEAMLQMSKIDIAGLQAAYNAA